MSSPGPPERPQTVVGSGTVERVRERHPDDPGWRADALAGSRHSRLIDRLQLPLESHDVERSARICAAVCRALLQDLAPALMLLPAPTRQRVQTLAAYGLTLFDFARQSGLEGERLAAINRWQFDLEQALAGRPAGQPVFVEIAELERSARWSRDGFARLHRLARRRCVVTRPESADEATQQADELGAALAELATGASPAAELVDLTAALIRLRSLQELGDDLRRHRVQLPVNEVAETWDPERSDLDAQLTTAVEAECARIEPRLSARGIEADDRAAPDLRAAIRYSRLVGISLLRQIRSRGSRIVDRPPRVGLAARLVFLIRARWGGG